MPRTSGAEDKAASTLISEEKEGSEGTLWFGTWEAYATATRLLWARFPETLAAGFRLRATRPPRGMRRTAKAWAFSLREIARFVLRPRALRSTLSPCDVVLFHSSSKPSIQGPMTGLAARLTRSGLSCAVLSSTQGQIWRRDASSSSGIARAEIDYFSDSFEFGRNRLSSLLLLPRAVLAAVALFAAIVSRPSLSLGHIFANPFDVVYRLMRSRHRLTVADEMLGQLSPRLAVTM